MEVVGGVLALAGGLLGLGLAWGDARSASATIDGGRPDTDFDALDRQAKRRAYLVVLAAVLAAIGGLLALLGAAS